MYRIIFFLSIDIYFVFPIYNHSVKLKTELWDLVSLLKELRILFVRKMQRPSIFRISLTTAGNLQKMLPKKA